MRVLVTGSAGFIGSRLVPRLAAAGHRVLGVDLREPPGDAGGEYARADVRDAAALGALCERFRPDLVIHLAAIHHIPTCEARPAEALAVNVVGTQVVLDAAAAAGSARVVLASSGAVYAWCDGPLAPDRTPVQARDVYSLSKITNEQQVALWRAGGAGRVAVVARLFNVLGAGDPNAHLLPDILRQLDRSRPSCEVRLGNTATRRDYVYVDDAADALARMADAPLEAGVHVFNVGTGREYTAAEIVARLGAMLGVACEIVPDPARTRAVDRPGQLADIAATVERLGWRPRVGLDEALRLTCAS